MSNGVVGSLETGLQQATRLIWPKACKQELLFDLGERKQRVVEAKGEAIRGIVDRWEDSGIVMGRWPSMRSWTVAEVKETIPLVPSCREVDVSARITAWAGLLGTAPKTLANSLSRWFICARDDHRWLLTLARLSAGERIPDGLLYHRRSVGALGAALGRIRAGLAAGQLDQADALVLLSMVLNFQHRRPTSDIRANRGANRSRRGSPKPAVSLEGTLLRPGQVEGLLAYAERTGNRPLVLLVLEAALTEAFMCSHSARYSARDAPSPGAWHDLIREVLGMTSLQPLTGEEHDFFCYRLGIMEAYSSGRPFCAPPSGIKTHPYVEAVMYMQKRYRQRTPGEVPASLRHVDWEGKAVLAHAVRSVRQEES